MCDLRIESDNGIWKLLKRKKGKTLFRQSITGWYYRSKAILSMPSRFSLSNQGSSSGLPTLNRDHCRSLPHTGSLLRYIMPRWLNSFYRDFAMRFCIIRPTNSFLIWHHKRYNLPLHIPRQAPDPHNHHGPRDKIHRGVGTNPQSSKQKASVHHPWKLLISR